MTQIKDSMFMVTGAASGIGRAVAIGAARAGAYVLATDVELTGLTVTAATIQEAGGRVEAMPLDVGDAGQIDLFADRAGRMFPHHRLILLNNAGVGLGSGTFVQNELADFAWLLNINLWGVIRMSKAFLPLMLNRPGSHIANVSSVFGFCGPPETAAYSTAKFAVRGFTDVLRNELAGTGVGVSTVFPGGVRTNIAATSRLGGGRTEAQRAIVAEKFAQRSMTSPEQAAEVILTGIRKNKARILIGFDAQMIDWITRLLPTGYSPVLLPGIEKTFLPKEARNPNPVATPSP